ncbi:MAG: RecX family transcriptional regulator [Bacteroidota bacterium]
MTCAEQELTYRRIARYCAYQERTEKEVRDKLYALGIRGEADYTTLIQKLKEDAYLDEDRYVTLFVSSKLRRNQWGKRKIEAVLLEKGLSPEQIATGLSFVSDENYRAMIWKVAKRKKALMHGGELRQNKQRLINYLVQKGYEHSIVNAVTQELYPT